MKRENLRRIVEVKNMWQEAVRIVGSVVCGVVLVVGCSTSVSPDHLNKRYTVRPYLYLYF